jgi:hypothetical protein
MVDRNYVKEKTRKIYEVLPKSTWKIKKGQGIVNYLLITGFEKERL